MNTNNRFLRLYGDGFVTEHVYLSYTSTGKLQAYRGGGALLGETDDTTLNLNTWHYVELYVTLSDTVGEVKLRVDGKTPLGWSDLTNVDTKNGGTASVFDSVYVIGQPGGPLFEGDDFYICNGAGTKNNDLLGDTKVITLLPDGNGNYSQLTGSDADSVDNYLLVDEATPSTADYVGSATDGLIDTYTFADLSETTGTVAGVQVGMYALKSDAGSKSLRAVARRSGVDASGDDKPLQTSADVHDQVWENDPTTGTDWTIANVNDSEFGVEVRP